MTGTVAMRLCVNRRVCRGLPHLFGPHDERKWLYRRKCPSRAVTSRKEARRREGLYPGGPQRGPGAASAGD